MLLLFAGKLFLDCFLHRERNKITVLIFEYTYMYLFTWIRIYIRILLCALSLFSFGSLYSWIVLRILYSYFHGLTPLPCVIFFFEFSVIPSLWNENYFRSNWMNFFKSTLFFQININFCFFNNQLNIYLKPIRLNEIKLERTNFFLRFAVINNLACIINKFCIIFVLKIKIFHTRTFGSRTYLSLCSFSAVTMLHNNDKQTRISQ